MTNLLAIDAKDYFAERSMIQPLLISLIWGMSCSAITLFSLPFGKWYQSRSLGNNFVKKSDNVVKKRGLRQNRKIREASKISEGVAQRLWNVPSNKFRGSSNKEYARESCIFTSGCSDIDAIWNEAIILLRNQTMLSNGRRFSQNIKRCKKHPRSSKG